MFEREGTYYLAYDWKQGGSECTPSNYQACIAYATAPSAMGPWTYQGIILGGTSATTVHPSIVEHDGSWWITYHTKDAVNGGHFRRSIAIDEVQWDGDRILPVVPTRADDPAFRLTDNVALAATAAASFTEQPPMTLRSINDGFRATTALLPPDQWGNYRGTTSSNATDWLQYTWDAPVRTGSVGIELHRDGNWIRPPASWLVEYLDDAGDWQPVQGATYPTATDTWHTVTFTPVTTTALRATFRGQDEGAYVHSVAVSEWEVYAVQADALPDVDVATPVGTAPDLPEAVRVGARLAVDARQLASRRPGAVRRRGHVHRRGPGARAVRRLPDRDRGGRRHGRSGRGRHDGPDRHVAASGTVGRGRLVLLAGHRPGRRRRRDVLPHGRSRRASVPVRGPPRRTPGTSTSRSPRRASRRSPVARPTRRATRPRRSRAPSRWTPAHRRSPRTLDAATRAVTVGGSDALSGLCGPRAPVRRHGRLGHRRARAVDRGARTMLPHELVVRARDRAGNTATTTVVDVPLGDGAQLQGNVAPYATPTTSFTSGWEAVAG